MTEAEKMQAQRMLSLMEQKDVAAAIAAPETPEELRALFVAEQARREAAGTWVV